MPRIVEAAGGIIYRARQDQSGVMKFSDNGSLPQGADPSAALDTIEVCIVHRPKYDDWSWPKGKLENNETHRHAAVREMGEESGVQVQLGPIIGDIEYPIADEGRRKRRTKEKTLDQKHVVFWMATPLDDQEARRRHSAFGPVLPADKDEIDTVVWVPVQRARKLLTHILDRNILDRFVALVKAGAAQARTLLIVRHGKAEARKQWKGEDGNRPITPRGAAAAFALGRELACYSPDRLVSSPWLRCMQTIEIFSWQTGLPIITAGELTEDAFAADPDAAWRRFSQEIDHMLDTGMDTAVCMHRPVIGGIFTHLRDICASETLAKRLIAKSPYMPTGCAIVLAIIRTGDGPRIIDIQKVAPLVY